MKRRLRPASNCSSGPKLLAAHGKSQRTYWPQSTIHGSRSHTRYPQRADGSAGYWQEDVVQVRRRPLLGMYMIMCMDPHVFLVFRVVIGWASSHQHWATLPRAACMVPLDFVCTIQLLRSSRQLVVQLFTGVMALKQSSSGHTAQRMWNAYAQAVTDVLSGLRNWQRGDI